MGGFNPYIEKPKTSSAQKAFKITFLPEGKTIEIKPGEEMPSSETGLPGSILDIALASDIDIDHACGGVCACSTCHIIVQKGLESCNSGTDDEEDQLDQAPGLTPQSRLACQCVPDGTQDLVVEIPNWNRNLVRE
jgi:2Fe-2S ferredoxin